ncbi:uncharacterized protein K452DRAFT_292109 [Aplosporella prunicola CBS 121167]|uniref:Plant basic secretory protein n=1 Tax=Aplosporella prunicola CBS 121167 TaxID=1176127 RepID=A0A6A6AYD1_9PEZI|nr:uncharacterized protein K452DRAFT_292109 [Aplosporella prunicola CBS 121167]KAF2136780.1 hypothetical protein K452DRAFT_292109 [Aplosporella prunicola CBS 121167]
MPLQPTYFQQPMTPAPTPSAKPPKPPRKPLLRLELRDLSHSGTTSFLTLLDVSSVLDEAVAGVLNLLYTAHSHIPPIRSVTLILRPMHGVAYTTGKDIDSDHKEIHFSTDYITSVPQERRRREMLGVIRHEMVHCWQWNAMGSAPGGLIEGIADYVRLRCGFVPPHWKQECDGDWDAGYQHTAYFLDYLDNQYGAGSVMAINESLKCREYKEKTFWKGLFGKDVEDLWQEYGRYLKSKDDKLETEDELKKLKLEDGKTQPQKDAEPTEAESSGDPAGTA